MHLEKEIEIKKKPEKIYKMRDIIQIEKENFLSSFNKQQKSTIPTQPQYSFGKGRRSTLKPQNNLKKTCSTKSNLYLKMHLPIDK